jgi:hypothetical protein
VTILATAIAIATGWTLIVILWFVGMNIGRQVLMVLTFDGVFMIAFGILMLVDQTMAMRRPTCLAGMALVIRQALRLLAALLAAAVIVGAFGLSPGGS